MYSVSYTNVNPTYLYRYCRRIDRTWAILLLLPMALYTRQTIKSERELLLT